MLNRISRDFEQHAKYLQSSDYKSRRKIFLSLCAACAGFIFIGLYIASSLRESGIEHRFLITSCAFLVMLETYFLRKTDPRSSWLPESSLFLLPLLVFSLPYFVEPRNVFNFGLIAILGSCAISSVISIARGKQNFARAISPSTTSRPVISEPETTARRIVSVMALECLGILWLMGNTLNSQILNKSLVIIVAFAPLAFAQKIASRIAGSGSQDKNGAGNRSDAVGRQRLQIGSAALLQALALGVVLAIASNERALNLPLWLSGFALTSLLKLYLVLRLPRR